jgi:putative membrane protein
MMYGYGPGAWWMVLMPLLWVMLIGAVVWAVVWIVRPSPATGSSVAVPNGGPGAVAPSARQILDRRYSTGEIDEATYTRMRARLTDREPREQ